MDVATPMVNLFTDDIEAALAFYAGRLGFAETFRTPTEGRPEHVELRVDGFTLGLATAEAAARVHGIEAHPGTPGFELVLWTENVDAVYAELVAGGAPAVTPPHDTGNGNRNAVVRDPDGNLVGLVMKRR